MKENGGVFTNEERTTFGSDTCGPTPQPTDVFTVNPSKQVSFDLHSRTCLVHPLLLFFSHKDFAFINSSLQIHRARHHQLALRRRQHLSHRHVLRSR